MQNILLTGATGRVGASFFEYARDKYHFRLAARRIERVLWNDPATGVMRHADAGYEIAIDHARACGLNLPMLDRGGERT